MPENSVKLGLMPPLTGLVGIYGEEISRAGQIACQEVNENGGVLGRPLVLVIEDDGSLPESAVAAAKKLVEQHQCSAIIGNLLSNSRIAVAYQVAEPHKIPYLNFSFYEGSILSRYFFHFAALPNQQIDKMIPYMREKFGPRMFFAGNNYEWPRGSINAAKISLQQAGGEVVGEEYYPIGTDLDDIERLLDHLEAAAPDVFVPYFAGTDQVNLLTRFTERGLKKSIAVVMGHYDEMMASQLSSQVRAGFYSSNTYFMTVDTAENRHYLSRLAALPEVDGIWPQGNGILTNFGEATYSCVKAFAKAANEAGSLEAEALVVALKTQSILSPQGSVQMNPTHHHAKVNTYLSLCKADGEFEIIEKFGAIEPVLPERYQHQRLPDQTTLEEDVRLKARILERMSEAVLLVNNLDGAIVYANASAERMFGYSNGEMTGLLAHQLNAPTYYRDPQETTTEIINAINLKGAWQGEVHHIRKDGSHFWSAATATSFTHPVYGEVLLGVLRDITQRKRIEKELQQERDFANSLLNTAPVIILLLDTQGRILHVNPFFEQLSGYCFADIKGKDWFNTFLPERDHDRIRKLFFQSLDEKKGQGNINSIITHGGEEREIEWNDQVMFNEDGKSTGVLAIGQDVTDREASKNTLLKTEQRLNEAQRMAKIGSWELNLVENSLWWSDENFRIFGLEVNKFGASYEAFLEALHPDDRDMVNQAYTSSLETKQPYAITHRLLMKDGAVKYVHEQCETLYDVAGQAVLSKGTAQEITQQVLAEKHLQESKNRFHTLSRIAPVGIFEADAHGKNIYVNDTWLAITGMRFEQAMGDGWINALYPDDKLRVLKTWMAAVQQNKPFALEYRLLNPDGKPVWLYGQAEASRDEAGNISSYVGTITNIDERKKTELTIFEAQQRMRRQQRAMLLFAQKQKIRAENMSALYRQLSESVASHLNIERVSIWLFNKANDCLICEDLYLFSSKQHVLGMRLSVKDYPGYFKAMQSSRVISAEDASTHPDTAEFTEHYLKPNLIRSMMDAPLRDGSGNVIGVVCLEAVGEQRHWFSDEENFASSIADMLSLSIELFARQRAEDRLTSYQGLLEKKVEQRTHELEEINKELESFTYSVSHDLRTPLRGIDGFSQILLDQYSQQLDEKGQDYLNRVRAGAQRMGLLINDMLQLSRANREEINLDSFNLSSLAELSVAELKQAEPERRVDIRITPDMQVKSDPRLMRMVMDNLIGNAWKFSSKVDQACIEVGCLIEADETIYFVRDNGGGFDMQYADKLFQVFQRLHHASEFPGTGVGLSIVARLVKRLGGCVWAKSEPGNGAIFYFTLNRNE